MKYYAVASQSEKASFSKERVKIMYQYYPVSIFCAYFLEPLKF